MNIPLFSLMGVRVLGRGLVMAITMMFALGVGGRSLQAAQQSDYDVIAAYLPVFLRYVQWPEGSVPGEPVYRIGVVGKDPFGQALDRAVLGRKVGGAKIEIARAASASALPNCQVVFLAFDAPGVLSLELQRLAGKPVLTAVYRRNRSLDLEPAATIEFVVVDARVRYVVNMSAFSAQGLQALPGLLEAAHRMEKKP